MQKQSSGLRVASALLAAVVTITIVPAVYAQTVPSEPLEARIGRPPGVSDDDATALVAERRTSNPPRAARVETVAAEARPGLPPGSGTEARASLWQVFVIWLRAQALDIANP